jgi:dUTP pyrophosphatase
LNDFLLFPVECCTTTTRTAPRSGLAWKNHIDVGAGVVDADYRGNVGVVLFNFSDSDFSVSTGDRVAQLILEKIHVGAEVVETDELPSTSRGEGGFGSTGVAGEIASQAPDSKKPKV